LSKIIAFCGPVSIEKSGNGTITVPRAGDGDAGVRGWSDAVAEEKEGVFGVVLCTDSAGLRRLRFDNVPIDRYIALAFIVCSRVAKDRERLYAAL
jgi:hypothetical protein